MMIDFNNDAALYAALLERDSRYEGRAFVGVSSTGVFCRLTCPARKPKRENCTFYDSVAACLEAGFRPCKRCHPMRPAAEADPCVQRLLAELDADPTRRWSEGDVIRLGFDPSTVRRAFKRQFGTTFLEMARLGRLRDGFVSLASGDKVIEAQHEAGFSSPSAFRDAFARHLGVPPGSLRKDTMLRADWFETPLGSMIAVSDPSHLHLLEFAERKALKTELQRLQKSAPGGIGLGRFAPTDQVEAELGAFFNGDCPNFSVKLAYHGSAFTRDVWRALEKIPAGETRTYGDLARLLGRPSATRAVARANGANQIAILIPCHRVLGADGSLTGYGGGLWRKQKLIDLEQQYLRQALSA